MSQRTFWEWSWERGGEFAEGKLRRAARGALNWDDVEREEGGRLGRAHQLHWQLECRLGVVDLVITDNRRRMITAKVDRGRHRIRLHHMFLGCGAETTTAIARFAEDEDDAARKRIEGYIAANRDAITFRPDEDELVVEGEHYDLESVLSSVASLLDEEQRAEVETVGITWGRDGRGSKSIRFGSYDFDQELIRVHPALDCSWVPDYFVEYIVYHELLHAICTPVDAGEQRKVHTREFEELERLFPQYEEAVEWESNNLRRILQRES